MTSPFFPPAHEKDWLGADAMYLRIKNLGSVGVRWSDGWRGVVES